MQLTPTPVVEATGVDVVLNGVPIVRGAGLSITAGETIAILGNNGSGKTTLMRALIGLVPHRGSIRLFGTELEHFRDWRRIGYVPQRSSANVQQATAREVAASGRLARRRPFWPELAADAAAVNDALAEVGMTEHRNYPFVRLSGGQQQRVLIARAIATGADLMLWDEPLAGVDQSTQQLLAEVAAGFKAQGRTTILVLHELGPFAGLIDRSIVLADGRVMPPDFQRDEDHGGHEVEDLRRPRAHYTGWETE